MNEYISRQAAIDACNNDDGGHAYGDVIQQRLRLLPSAQPERKKGKWNRMGLNDAFHCLECGATFIVIQGQERMNFCPNCGAKMDGERKES